jgi:hypothetical protein
MYKNNIKPNVSRIYSGVERGWNWFWTVAFVVAPLEFTLPTSGPTAVLLLVEQFARRGAANAALCGSKPARVHFVH